jgi:hypothetical protein
MRSKLAAVLAVALGTLALGASVAQADDLFGAAFTGSTGAAGVNPPIPPPPAGNGQTGSYSFTGACAAPGPFVDPTDLAESGQLIGCTISSTGTYSNIACGTGTATGTATVTLVPEPDPVVPHDSPVTVGYTIQFVGGQGPIRVTSVSHGDGTGGTVIGFASLKPIPATGCATTAATGFDVTGAFAGVLTDTSPGT